MEANDFQIGGNHYKTHGLSHWDLIDEYEICYLAGCASKYLTRFRRKNGLQDLQKAQHYIDKMIERRSRHMGRAIGDVPPGVLDTFFADNGVEGPESEPIRLVFNWLTPQHLKSARAMVQALIDDYDAEPTKAYVNQDR